MQCESTNVKQYLAYMLMHASMMNDLACVDEYAERLIDGKSLSEFEISLQNMIERAIM